MDNAIKTACAADFADCVEMFALAEQILDLTLNQRAVTKYRDLCDFLHTFGFSIAQVIS